MIEAELKARVRDPEGLRDRLRRLGAEEISVYHDTYYDWPGRQLTVGGKELRVRTIDTSGQEQVLLTYKESATDAATDSKPEHETTVHDAGVMDIILTGLGMEHMVAFRKDCANYRFTACGRGMLATVATIREISGSFLELETQATESELAAALDDLRAVLADLDISADDLTTDTYTGAVLGRGQQR